MQKSLLIVFLGMCIKVSIAQSFNLQWIACPQADSTSEVWFRQDWKLRDYPTHATMTIASTGKVNAYINERNISTALWFPARSNNDGKPICITLDVTRFLQPGNNVIAIWYAPSWTHLERQQVAIALHARYANNEYTCLQSDENWLTRPATVSFTTDGSEIDESYNNGVIWNSEDFDVATWQSATAVEGPSLPYSYYFAGYPAVKVSKIQTPRYFDVVGDSVYYQFDKAFKGQVRVTLRGAKRGQKIQFNGLTYTCSGELDEQAYPRFAVKDVYRILISGDKDFKPEQIQQVEGLEVVPYFHQSYQY